MFQLHFTQNYYSMFTGVNYFLSAHYQVHFSAHHLT